MLAAKSRCSRRNRLGPPHRRMHASLLSNAPARKPSIAPMRTKLKLAFNQDIPGS
jgi:hypothetical protein